MLNMPLFFIFWEIFVTFTTTLPLFFSFFDRKILISFTSFLLWSFFIFLIIFRCSTFRHFYIYEKNYKTNLSKNYKKLDWLEDLKMSLLHFLFVMIYIIHKMVVLIKNNLNYLSDSIFECFLKECNRLLIFFKKVTFS